MKAAVYHRPKTIAFDDWPDPAIEDPRDAIVRVTSTAICGSDLHIYNGMFPQVKDMVVGHEFMGVIEDVGSEVQNLKRGDRVVVPFPIACGECFFCKHGSFPNCENSNPKNYGPEGGLLKEKGGGLFGYTDLYGGYAGGQAEAVRVPYADIGPRKVPEGIEDETVLFLTDIFPTGWTALDWAGLQGGETVAVWGCGPVGIMAMKSAWLLGAERVIGVDILPYRLEKARLAGKGEVINGDEVNAIDAIREMTDGRGADVVIDAVGMEAHRSFIDKLNAAAHLQRGSISAFEDCLSAVRRGGKISVVGVYGSPYDNFPWNQIFDKGVAIFSGQAPVQKYIDQLFEMVMNGKVVLDDVISHRLPLSEVSHGYKIFNEKEDDCVKIVLKP